MRCVKLENPGRCPHDLLHHVECRPLISKLKDNHSMIPNPKSEPNPAEVSVALPECRSQVASTQMSRSQTLVMDCFLDFCPLMPRIRFVTRLMSAEEAELDPKPCILMRLCPGGVVSEGGRVADSCSVCWLCGDTCGGLYPKP